MERNCFNCEFCFYGCNKDGPICAGNHDFYGMLISDINKKGVLVCEDYEISLEAFIQIMESHKCSKK